MHRIDLPYVSDVREVEFPAEVLQQVILNNKHECLINRFERSELVMELDQDRLGCHLPIHPVAPTANIVFSNFANAHTTKKVLSRRPHRAGSVQGLELDADEICYLSISSRDKNIIDTASRYGHFRYNMDFVSGLMPRQEMQAIGTRAESLVGYPNNSTTSLTEASCSVLSQSRGTRQIRPRPLIFCLGRWLQPSWFLFRRMDRAPAHQRGR